MTVQPGLPNYKDLSALPDLVARAVRGARAAGYEKACLPEVGLLLRLLAAARRDIRIGESGTACGVGAAWLASAMDASSTLVTVELDPERARVAARLMEQTSRVSVLEGDWALLQAHGPFDLLFVDGGPAKTECDVILSLLAPRGLLVFDDLTPPERWTPEQRRTYVAGDPIRNAWRDRPGCAVTELRVTEYAAVLLVAKLQERPS